MDAASSRRLFDANASDYDRVNTVISLGLDARWRRWVAKRCVVRPHAFVLDAFAGTGLVGIEAAEMGADVTLADASDGMLAMAAGRAAERHVRVREVPADLAAGELPFGPRSFDAIAVSFGLRYLDDPAAVLHRLGRALVPGGRLVVLEFVRPPRKLIPCAAGVYFFRVLPRIASALAGRRELYDYLVRSVDRIGTATDLEWLVTDAGYDVVERRSFGFGLVAGLVCMRQA